MIIHNEQKIGENGLGLRVAAALPLRDKVAARLREAIANGSFKPGERLVERMLCEMAGVSRTSIREALRQLESEGLVVNPPNRGPIVAPIGFKDAEDIYEARAVLEGLAARLFVRRASDEQHRALSAAFEQLDKAGRTREIARYLAAKAGFYEALLAGAGNKVVTDALRTIHVRVNQLRATSLTQTGRLKQSIDEIRRLVEALKARNEETAWVRSLEHVHQAAKAALRAIDEGNVVNARTEVGR